MVIDIKNISKLSNKSFRILHVVNYNKADVSMSPRKTPYGMVFDLSKTH